MRLKIPTKFFILVLIGFLLRSSFLTPCGAMVRDEDETSLEKLKKSLYQHYIQNDFAHRQDIGHITQKYKIYYQDRRTIATDKISFFWKECFHCCSVKNVDIPWEKYCHPWTHVHLHLYAKENLNLLGVSGCDIYPHEIMGIEVFSTFLFLESIKQFNTFSIPKLEKHLLEEKDFPPLNTISKVSQGCTQISESAPLYTGKLRDCIGVVARGLSPENKNCVLLAHYTRDDKICLLINNLKENFKTKKPDIYLISAHYTPHLFEIVTGLTKEGYSLKGWDIHDAYAEFMAKNCFIRIHCVNLKDPFEKHVLVFPDKGTVFILDKKIKFSKDLSK